MNKITSVLIVQTAFLGDVILITPLIRAVYEYFGHPSIDVMVIPQTKVVLQNNPLVRNLIIFDKRKNKLQAFITTLVRLQHAHYDVVFTPHSSLTTGLLLFLAGIPRRVGFDRWTARHLLTDKLPDERGKHKIIKNLSLMQAFTQETFDSQTSLYPLAADDDSVLKFLPTNDKKRVIALAPGSVWYTKRWFKEHYISLSELLYEAGYTLIFTGSKEERPLCEDIIRSANIDAINTAGELSLLQSAALISKCHLLICNDSGALHIGNAMQTTVFAVFGPTVKEIGYYPYRENDRVFEVTLACRPCGSHGHNACPQGHHNCMRNVLPESIFREAMAFLDKSNSDV